jgi:hypothetical protein
MLRPSIPMVERREDMSPSGRLRLIMETDGDIIVSIAAGDHSGGIKSFADVQFTVPFIGGGGSQRTYRALRELMRAMAQDNADPYAQGRVGKFKGEDILGWEKLPEAEANGG